MNKLWKTCSDCSYFCQACDECCVNPPVIIEALIVRALNSKGCDDIIAASSFRPMVGSDYPACRFFEKRGA